MGRSTRLYQARVRTSSTVHVMSLLRVADCAVENVLLPIGIGIGRALR